MITLCISLRGDSITTHSIRDCHPTLFQLGFEAEAGDWGCFFSHNLFYHHYYFVYPHHYANTSQKHHNSIIITRQFFLLFLCCVIGLFSTCVTILLLESWFFWCFLIWMFEFRLAKRSPLFESHRHLQSYLLRIPWPSRKVHATWMCIGQYRVKSLRTPLLGKANLISFWTTSATGELLDFWWECVGQCADKNGKEEACLAARTFWRLGTEFVTGCDCTGHLWYGPQDVSWVYEVKSRGRQLSRGAEKV
jgi:hypothetical protein